MAGDAHQTVSVTLTAETGDFQARFRVSRESLETWREAAEAAGDAAADTADSLDEAGSHADSTARHVSVTGEAASNAADEMESLADAAGDAGEDLDDLGGAADHTTALIWALYAAIGGWTALEIGESAVSSWHAYEAALVGVGKVTDLAGQELAALGEQIGALALRPEMGATTQELLSITQAAGQLGVRGSESLLKFTSTVAMLQGATDVVGAEGAMQLVRLLEVTGEGTDAIDRMGSAVVALGNAYAATESEIVRTALEIAKGGASFDVTAAQAAGLAAAFASIGIQAELSRGVTQRALQAINDAVRQGGTELEALVALTGQSADVLRQAFAEDAVSVFTDVLAALRHLREAGGDVGTTLRALGLTAGDDASTLGALAKTVDTVTQAVDQSDQAWIDNIALLEEAARAATTAEAQWRVIGNVWTAASTIIGAELSPALLAAARDVADLVLAARDTGQIAEWAAAAADGVRAAAEAAAWAADHWEVLAGAAAALVTVKLVQWATAAAGAVQALTAAMLANPYIVAAAAVAGLVTAAIAARNAQNEAREAAVAYWQVLRDNEQVARTDEALTRDQAAAKLAEAEAIREVIAARLEDARIAAAAQAQTLMRASGLTFEDMERGWVRGPRGIQTPITGETYDAWREARDQVDLYTDALVTNAQAQDRLREILAGTGPGTGPDTSGGGGPGAGNDNPPPPNEPPGGLGSDDGYAAWVAQTRAATAAHEAMAIAVGQGTAATREAEIAATAEGVVLQYGARRRAEIIALVTAEAEARQRLDIARAVADLDRQIAAQRALTVAHGQGAAAVAEVSRQIAIAEALRQHGIEQGTEEAAQITERVAALYAEAEAREKAAPEGEARDRLDGLQTEADYLRAIGAERSLTADQLAVIASLTDRQIDLTSDQAREELRLAKAIGDQARATELARAASTSWRDGAVAAVHDVAVAAKDNAAIAQDAFSSVFDRWDDAFTEFFRDFSRGIADVEDLLSALGDAVLDQVAQIAAQQVTAGLATSLWSALGVGPAAAAGGQASASGVDTGDVLGLGTLLPSLTGGQSIGNALVTGSVGRALGLYSPTTLYGAAGPGSPVMLVGPNAGVVGGAAGGMTGFGGALAAGIDAAPWGLAGSLAASAFGFSSGNQWADMGLSTLGSVGGGALGASLIGGAAGGPIGAAAGAFLAMMGGDLIGGLFGKPLPNASQSIDIQDGQVLAKAPEGRLLSDEDIAAWGEASRAALVGPLQTLADTFDLSNYAVATSWKDGAQRVEVHGGTLGDQSGRLIEVADLGEAGLVAIRTIIEDLAQGDDSLAGALAVVRDSSAATAAELAGQIAIAADWSGAIDAAVTSMQSGAAAQIAALDEQAAAWTDQARAMIAPAREVADILTAAGELDAGQASADMNTLVRAMVGLGDVAAPLSDVQASVALMDRQLNGLQTILTDTGTAAEDAAAQVAGLRDELLAQAAADLNDQWVRALETARGRDHVNTIRDSVAAYQQALADMQAVGGDTSLV
ncbi:phage tail tape measure protein, partial [Roseospira marina]